MARQGFIPFGGEATTPEMAARQPHLSANVRKEMRRRAAIEPVIGHLKVKHLAGGCSPCSTYTQPHPPRRPRRLNPPSVEFFTNDYVGRVISVQDIS
jgi:hypothetical protein